jgi:magnesium chelatase family protein
MISHVTTLTLTGLHGQLVEVETDVRNGLPGMTIVGMGNKAVTEARERIRSAITHSQLTIPPKKYTMNLAPADVPKDGSQFDLPLALSLLVATGQLRQEDVNGALFAAELSLNGSLKAIKGAVAIARAAKQAGITRVFLPPESASQGALVDGIAVYAPPTLEALFLHLKGECVLTPVEAAFTALQPPSSSTLDQVIGHEQAKRALVIAAAGHHNILLYGPPGTGKTLLASTLPSLLPTLSSDATAEATHLHSLTSARSGVISHPPFRAPHHSTGLAALIGGGVRATPGEISLAHHGILLLDELPEFSREAIDALRQPLQSGTISITRLYGTIEFPARFICVATMNPCPCGFLGDTKRPCTCSSVEKARYRRRISGPIFDRFDICVPVYRTNSVVKKNDQTLLEIQHAHLLKMIDAALLRQKHRFKSSIEYNAYAYSGKDLLHAIPLASKELIDQAARRLQLSTRAVFSVIKVARTIADLADSNTIEPEHIAEALQLRTSLPSDP